MKLLLCHNYYQQRGGEDESFEDEAALLAEHGHDVVRYTVHNDSLATMGGWQAARRTLWNGDTYRALRTLIRRERPVLMHCTNTFPLLSPAAYYAARAEGVPVVQSLRNYRLLCANALFLRDGRPCEACLGKAVGWPGVVHACYRGSRAASAVVALMTATHRAARTWQRGVDLYYTPSAFARQKFIEAGWPGARIAVKANFVSPDPGPGDGRGGYAVYVGRLSPEKGIHTLLAAWARLPGAPRLKIVGDGPLAPTLAAAAAANPALELLGRRSRAEVLSIVGAAALLVLPSLTYETLGRTLIEAFARGTPVVASRLGAMAEVVGDGVTGRLFAPGDAADLATQVQRLLDEPAALARCRAAARQEFEAKYTAARNYQQLLDLYTRVLQGCHRLALEP